MVYHFRQGSDRRAGHRNAHVPPNQRTVGLSDSMLTLHYATMPRGSVGSVLDPAVRSAAEESASWPF
jgi:hypothetical protein